ncbi:MAG: hypothetical protein IPK14_15965 [Blastocatellia bacterium]|nr:hypothetical protein [Blastocatellia bacterium]MBL8193369.1 hypothetical protein [Blastocatellia bacterium]MBN8721873.1 hypothetical protein [Acidobacteriota bacterium]
MKTCPVCNRNYSDHMKYCSRDGTTLQTGILLTVCPECGINYPNKTTCPIHNLELVTYSQKANPTANFCNLCNQFYPLATQNCPLHGVELQVKTLNNKGGFESSIDVSPVVANILEEITSSKLNESENPGANSFVTEKTVVTSNLENTPPSASIETKNLTAPAVLPFDTLGKYAVSHFSSSADRKLFVALALIVLLSIAGFAAYSLPYALEWAKVSADTEETSTITENKPVNNTVEEINKTIEPLASPTEPTNNSQVIPDLTNPVNSTTSKDKTTNVTPKKIDVSNKSLSSEPNKKPTTTITAKSKTTINPSKTSYPNKTTKVEAVNSGAKQPVVAKNQKSTNEKSTVVEKSKSSSLPSKEASANSSTNKPKVADQNTAKSPAKSPIRTWEPSVTTAEIKYPSRQKAKVVLSIANKSRLQTSNGYIYQFDLVVRELNGVGINWNSTSAYKSSYSGNSDAVSNFLDRRLAPNATERYRMSIRMTGHSIEDWFGEIIYKGFGIDENGNSVELRGSLALDNSF